jgi:hypothetical protein
MGLITDQVPGGGQKCLECLEGLAPANKSSLAWFQLSTTQTTKSKLSEPCPPRIICRRQMGVEPPLLPR